MLTDLYRCGLLYRSYKMDESIRDWFTKLEGKFDKMNELSIQKWTELSTKIDIYMPKQDELSKRVDAVEDDVKEIKADLQSKNRNNNLLIGAGTVAAVIIGVLLDHYLLK